MRACLLLFMLLLGYLPVTAVDGFNLPGSDYANFNADSWWVCPTPAAATRAVRPGLGSSPVFKALLDTAG
jgi:hypothetical protein